MDIFHKAFLLDLGNKLAQNVKNKNEEENKTYPLHNSAKPIIIELRSKKVKVN